MIAAYVCSHFARFPTAQRDSFPVLKNDVSVTMATGQGEVRRFAWAPEQKNSYLSPHQQNRAIREISMGRKYTQACGPLQKRQDTFRAKSLTKQLYHTLIECSILYWKEEIVFCVQSRHTRIGLPFAATVGSLLREESGHSGGDHGCGSAFGHCGVHGEKEGRWWGTSSWRTPETPGREVSVK